jgi:hypothetical protein
MEKFNLEILGVVDIENIKLVEINGGEAVSPWWGIASAAIQAAVIALNAWANAYVSYSVATGGKYVIHHAY